uniref:GCR328 n=1 Tax=Schmidtea mediterranea TaxID=79327 RepID=A0A193KUV8_SCHMD|nr:GCR328 [Schmidtea mediterranea]
MFEHSTKPNEIYKLDGNTNDVDTLSFDHCLKNKFIPGTELFAKCITEKIISFLENNKNPYSIVLQTIFSLSICVGIIGNFLVIMSVLLFQFMRNFANIFLLNLAISDILVLTIAAPFTLFNQVNLVYKFSPFFCQVQSGLQSTTVHVSVLSLMSISFERFYVIMFPMQYKMIFKNSRLKIWLLSIWLLSIALSMPLGYASEIVHVDGSNNTNQCKETWFGNQLYRKIYTFFSFFILYLIPLFFMLILHFILITKLWKMPKEITNSIRSVDYSNRRKKLSIILIMLCLIFLICWLPHHVRCIYNDFIIKIYSAESISRKYDDFILERLTPISQFMCYLNSSINPFCSLLISTKFRYCVKYIFKYLYSAAKHRGFNRSKNKLPVGKASSQFIARVRSINS